MGFDRTALDDANAMMQWNDISLKALTDSRWRMQSEIPACDWYSVIGRSRNNARPDW